MQTREMIKELTENPNKKFISYDWDTALVAETSSRNLIIKNDGKLQCGFNIKREWEEVKEPVTFMEAVKSKKDIKVEHEILECNEDFEEYVNLEELLYRLRDNFFSDVIADVLLEGKFYIED